MPWLVLRAHGSRRSVGAHNRCQRLLNAEFSDMIIEPHDLRSDRIHGMIGTEVRLMAYHHFCVITCLLNRWFAAASIVHAGSFKYFTSYAFARATRCVFGKTTAHNVIPSTFHNKIEPYLPVCFCSWARRFPRVIISAVYHVSPRFLSLIITNEAGGRVGLSLFGTSLNLFRSLIHRR